PAPDARDAQAVPGFQAESNRLKAFGRYSYKITFVDGEGKESNICDPFPLTGVQLGTDASNNTQNAVTLRNLPAPPQGSSIRIYRPAAGGPGYRFVATLNAGQTSYFDVTPDASLGQPRSAAAPDVTNAKATAINRTGDNHLTPGGLYSYKIAFVNNAGLES